MFDLDKINLLSQKGILLNNINNLDIFPIIKTYISNDKDIELYIRLWSDGKITFSNVSYDTIIDGELIGNKLKGKGVKIYRKDIIYIINNYVLMEKCY